MAHTLSIYDGVEATTIALASTGSGAGYFLEGYTPLDPQYTVSYSSSLFTDGARPVFSKSGNIIETIGVMIRGSSANDALERLRALKRAIWNARDAMQYHALRQPCYLTFNPHGATNAAYSTIVGGSVMEPTTLLDTDINSYEIRGITVTIEREPYWRAAAPTRSTTITNFAGTALSGSTVTPDWGYIAVSSVPGDLPALTFLTVTPTSGSFSNVVVGYSSQRRNPNFYSVNPLVEAEAMTQGTDTSSTANGGASGGNMSDCTFGTTTANAVRLSANINRVGRYRAFARCYANGPTVSMYLEYGERESTLASYVANPAVTASAAAWRMYDLGTISTPSSDTPTKGSAANTYVRLNVSRTSGSGSLYIDFLYFVPTEYYLTCSNFTASSSSTTTWVYQNIYPWTASNYSAAATTTYERLSGIGSGELRLPPGNGYITILTGDSNFGNHLSSNAKSVSLYYSALYLGARGSG